MAKTKSPQLKIFWVNKKKDSKLFASAANDSLLLKLKQVKFIRLEVGEKLFNNLVAMVQAQHLVAQRIFGEKGIYGELYPGSFRGGIYSLVSHWQNDPDTSLLDMAADLLHCLAVTHYFRNGNKRTALLTMGAFIYSLGYSLKDYGNKEVYLHIWEKLVLKVVLLDRTKSEIFIKNMIKAKLWSTIIFFPLRNK